MSKKILVIRGSARKGGNTAVLADEYVKGAKEAGNVITDLFLREMQMGDCLGCGACQMNGGVCVQKDDMGKVYEKMQDADVIVFASPVYFYTWNSLTKRVIDRTFAVENLLQNKTFYLLSAGAAPEEKYMGTMIDSFKQYGSCFRAGGNQVGGYVFAYGTNKPGDAVGPDAAKQAYELGLEMKEF